MRWPTMTTVVTTFLFLVAWCAAQPTTPPEQAAPEPPKAEELPDSPPAPKPPPGSTSKPEPGSAAGQIRKPIEALEPKREPKTVPESRFSDLALFFFGSGFAVFIALLGWSDQIRGLRKETQELQADFLKQNNLSRADLLPVILAVSADEQLESFTSLMQSGKLGSASAVRYLPLLRKWHQQTTRLERIQTWKYRLTVILAAVFFGSATLLVAGAPEMIFVLPPALVILAIFTLMIIANSFEQSLHTTLRKMMEHV